MVLLYDKTKYEFSEEVFKKFNKGEIGEYEFIDEATKVTEVTVENLTDFDIIKNNISDLNKADKLYVLVLEDEDIFEFESTDEDFFLTDYVKPLNSKLCLRMSEDEDEAFDIVCNEYSNEDFSNVMNNFFDITMLFEGEK